MKTQSTVEKKVRDIKRATRRKFSAEEKIRIVLEVFKAEESLASICRREGIHPNLYYSWSKEFLEAGKKRLNGDIQRQATSNEVLDLREENSSLKHMVAEQALSIRAYKKNLIGTE